MRATHALTASSMCGRALIFDESKYKPLPAQPKTLTPPPEPEPPATSPEPEFKAGPKPFGSRLGLGWGGVHNGFWMLFRHSAALQLCGSLRVTQKAPYRASASLESKKVTINTISVAATTTRWKNVQKSQSLGNMLKVLGSGSSCNEHNWGKNNIVS